MFSTVLIIKKIYILNHGIEVIETFKTFTLWHPGHDVVAFFKRGLGSILKCESHPDAVLIEDHRAGDMICSQCGLVVGDRLANQTKLI